MPTEITALPIGSTTGPARREQVRKESVIDLLKVEKCVFDIYFIVLDVISINKFQTVIQLRKAKYL